MISNIIEVKNFTKKYDSFVAVDNISFNVEKGTVFGFLGPNGAGKSTTINTLCTIVDKTEGSLKINGHDVTEQKSQVRNDIGIVFQESTLDGRLTVEENLKLHCDFYNVPKNEVRERVLCSLRGMNIIIGSTVSEKDSYPSQTTQYLIEAVSRICCKFEVKFLCIIG